MGCCGCYRRGRLEDMKKENKRKSREDYDLDGGSEPRGRSKIGNGMPQGVRARIRAEEN